MSDIRKWLGTIGLGKYAEAFKANEIGMDLLGQVDDRMPKDIGVSIGGHRLRIRNAIAKLTSAPAAAANLSATIPMHETTASSADRPELTVMFYDLVGSTALSAEPDIRAKEQRREGSAVFSSKERSTSGLMASFTS